MVVYICKCYFLSSTHSPLPPLCPQVCSPWLHLYSCPSNRFCRVVQGAQRRALWWPRGVGGGGGREAQEGGDICMYIANSLCFPRIEPASLVPPVLAGGFFTTSTTVWSYPILPFYSREHRGTRIRKYMCAVKAWEHSSQLHSPQVQQLLVSKKKKRIFTYRARATPSRLCWKRNIFMVPGG